MQKTRITAIIAEFNPLHKGHKYIIKRAKELTDGNSILVILSGNFTQRAEPAILEKHTRARQAIIAGADAVVEIPATYATGNAEVFAKAAVKIACSFSHVTHLVFGTEAQDLTLLKLIAKTVVKKRREFERSMKFYLKKGISFDNARTEVMKRLLPKIPGEVIEKTMHTPNNILAIEYLKELVRLKTTVHPIGVQRIKTPSASQIRAVVVSNSQHALALSSSVHDTSNQSQIILDSYNSSFGLIPVPKRKIDIPKSADLNYLTIANFEKFASLALFSLMTKLNEEIYNSNTELVNLIKNLHPTTYRQLKEQAPTKRFAVSRFARLALHCTLDITKKDINFLYKNTYVPYTNLLAVKKSGDSLFATLVLNQKTPLIVRGNKIKPKQNKYYHALKRIDEKAELLYESVSGVKVPKKCEFV
ncbi:MAG: nucleotidyltransferase family protein [Firmicutes bacterium]|nr:nucleotidyltransferase family protein [Bacillota bacterium]